MNRRQRKFEIFAQFCESLAELSTCKRMKVGAIVFPADFTRVVSVGYNGPASGLKNDKCANVSGYCGCVHAEANALLKLNPFDRESLILYSTIAPCQTCAGLIINSKTIHAVVFKGAYRDGEGLHDLARADIRVRTKENFHEEL